MNATFLVTVNLDDVSQPALIAEAETMQTDLINTGLDVISVEPWARPSNAGISMTGGGLPLPTQPPVQ